MPYIFYNCKVISIIDETPVVKTYTLQYPDTVPFSFKAGQFVMLDLPIEAKHTTRSYSIASAPNNANTIELCIVLKPGGPGTSYLFNEVKPGSEIKTSVAIGKFTLPESLDHDICFVCTGTGIAPFRSMITEIYSKGLPHKNIYLIFGNRMKEDILYRTEFEALALQEPTFKFIPVLSREEWEGARGYVHEVYEKLFHGNDDTCFYLCGWPAMLKEARQRLETMGYPRQQIRFESFE